MRRRRNKLACDADRRQEPLHDVPRRRRGLLREDLVLDHADRTVPRRPHRRDLQGLLRLDPGLDRRSRASVPASRPSAPAPLAAAAARRLLSAPLLWLVVAYLGALAVLLVSAFWTVNTFTGDVVRDVLARTTSGPCSPRRSTAPSRCAAWAWPPRSPSSAWCSPCRWRSTWPRSPRRAAAALAGHRDPHPAVGESTWSRRTPGGCCSPTAARSTGCSRWPRQRPRATACPPPSWCCPTSGCRT